MSRSGGKSSKAGKRKKTGGIWVLLGLLAALGAFAVWVRSLFQPAAQTHVPVSVVVPSGVGVSRIGETLEKKGVIRSAFAFTWYVRWHQEGSRFKAGRYALSGDMTLAQIVRALDLGPNSVYGDRIRVTIPEGYTLKQIAATLQEKGVTDGRKFLRIATDPESIALIHADFPLPKSSLEGYLFPATYYFRPHSPPEHVADAMVTNFFEQFARPYQRDIAARGRGLQAVVTEASMIEREAKTPEDRPRIAGVLDNRLKRGMRLDVDATVLYALGHHKDRVMLRDLNVDSPYNTYRHTGLPPGPIANPGLPSLLAALHPEPNDYLYYVARPNGAHIFTRTIAEHEAAKRQARLERQQHGPEIDPGG